LPHQQRPPVVELAAHGRLNGGDVALLARSSEIFSVPPVAHSTSGLLEPSLLQRIRLELISDEKQRRLAVSRQARLEQFVSV